MSVPVSVHPSVSKLTLVCTFPVRPAFSAVLRKFHLTPFHGTTKTLNSAFGFASPSLSVFGQALDRLVAVSSIRYRTSTSALSTSSSSRGLTSLRMGYLILRGASRLDAFSVYPFQAWLPGHRLGSLTGTPAARPSRSSRTKDSSSQISCARAG